MAIRDVVPFPSSPALDPLESDLREVLAAIALVAGGVARRVRISGLLRPEAAAGAAIAHAQEAGVEFALEPNETGGYTALVRRPPADPRATARGGDPTDRRRSA